LDHSVDAELPRMGSSSSDWSSHEIPSDLAGDHDSKRWDEWRDDLQEVAARANGDDLTISPPDNKHDISRPLPAQVRDRQTPGLPEKNLNLDL
ncbi:hypothetical protein, partial [Sphingomonas bacterium]|uniref:hypothetical protein n=1 Tax=Sphingomonas bacterium TaxID=1895847 RepID=UPI0015759293